jgi:hypothetical protein
LLIPWRDIKPEVERRRFGAYVTFRFEQVPPVRLRVSSRLAKQLVDRAGAEAEPID